jgi:ABC-type transport system involved in multi-copper enzyme maturation permease subunit
MKALIWKEMRETLRPFAAVFVVMAALALVPFGLAQHLGANASLIAGTVGLASLAPLYLVWVGANALARERAAGTLEVLGALPVTRARVWMVKVGVALVQVLVIGLVTAAIATSLTQNWYAANHFVAYALSNVAAACVVGLFLFSLGLITSGVRQTPFDALLFTALLLLGTVVAGLFLSTDLLPRLCGPQLGIIYPGIPGWTFGVLALTLSIVFLSASAAGWIRTAPLAYEARQWRTVRWALALLVVAVPGFFLGVRYLGQPRRADIAMLTATTLSPDGQWIAFDDCPGLREIDNCRLWLMRTDGTGLRCLSRRPAEHGFVWSADSRRLYFTWGNPNVTFTFLGTKEEWAQGLEWQWQAEVPSGRLRRVEVSGSEGAIAQNGDHPLVASRTGRQSEVKPFDRFLAVDRETGQVVESRPAFYWRPPHPLWSLDGQRVVFEMSHPEARQVGRRLDRPLRELWTARMVGTDLRGSPLFNPGLQPAGDLTLCGWTRDGRIIAQVETGRLLSIDPDTGQQTVILQSSVSDQEARP